MNRRQSLLAGLAWPAALCAQPAPAPASAQASPPRPVPPGPVSGPLPPRLVGELKPLGGERYQIGQIVIDKAARSFTVPGRVFALGKPLEYLATTPGGMKAYETLFELDAGGTEFNLACILIGLERDPGHVAALMKSDRAPLLGPRVALFAAWTEGGQRHKVPAAVVVLNPDAGEKPESVEWVYTGAPASNTQVRFAADVTGTLVGFKRDMNNVIESALPIGLGAYGSVRGHPMLPPNGSPIELIVEAVAAPK